LKIYHSIMPIIVLMIAGCSHHTTINSADLTEPLKIDNGRKMNDVWIIFTDGSKVEGENIILDNKSINWTDVGTSTNLSKPITEISEIVYFKRPAGAWDGLRLGALAGIALGVFVGDNVAKDFGIDNTGFEYELYKIGAMYFGFWGIVLGTPVGFVLGERNNYTLVIDTLPAAIDPENK